MNPIIEEKRPEIEALCRKHHVERLDLVGSAARDDFDAETSDLDFLVCFTACTPSEHANRYLDLLADLQDLFARDVDLIEQRAIRHKEIGEIFESEKIPVYAA